MKASSPALLSGYIFPTLQILNWTLSSHSVYPWILSLPPWGHFKQVSSLFNFWESYLDSSELSPPQVKYSLLPWVWSLLHHPWVCRCLTLTSIPGMILEQVIKPICSHLGNHRVSRATSKAFRTADYTRWIQFPAMLAFYERHANKFSASQGDWTKGDDIKLMKERLQLVIWKTLVWGDSIIQKN